MERIFATIIKGHKFFSLFEVGRPWNAIIAWLFSVLGGSLILGVLPNLTLIFIMFIITTIIYMGGTSLNDVFDTVVDSINMPYRPIERGDLTVKNVIYFSIFLYTIAILSSIFFSFQYLLSIIFMIITTVFYSVPPISFKNRGMWGSFVLALGTVFATSLFGAVLVSGHFFVNLNFLIPVISLTIFFTFFCVMKDFKDVKGDNYGKKRTIVIKIGFKQASIINIIGTLIFFTTTILAFYYLFKNIFETLFSFVFLVFLLFFEIKIFRSKKSDVAEKSWTWGRIIVLLFLLFLLVEFL